MTTYSTTADSYGVSKRVGRYEILLRVLTAVAAWRLHRHQQAQLRALSDRMLEDIGVNPWEIEAIIGSPNRDASCRARWLEFDDYPR